MSVIDSIYILSLSVYYHQCPHALLCYSSRSYYRFIHMIDNHFGQEQSRELTCDNMVITISSTFTLCIEKLVTPTVVIPIQRHCIIVTPPAAGNKSTVVATFGNKRERQNQLCSYYSNSS